MKKLFIAFVSAVSFALFAKADPIDFTSPTGTSFENAAAGAFSLEQQDEDGSSYWYSTGDEFGQITEDAPVYSGDRPAMFQNATQLKYFEIDSADRLYRSAYALPDGGEAQPVNIGTGVYFDSLVRFAAAEAGRAPEAGDKIGLWFKAVAAEDDPNGVGVTNLMVKAAYLEADNSVTVKDYAITKLDGQAISAADNLVPDSWHRVTIKALADASSVEGSVGFVVFIDGKVAASDEVKGDDDSFLASLNPTAQAWADKNALFPSLVAAGTAGGDTITSAAFLGVGAVDDVSFTPNAPTFAADSRFFTVKWDPKAFNSLTVNGQMMVVADGTCDIGGVGNEVGVSCVLADNYVVTGAVCDANSSFDLASMKFTLTGTSVATLLTQKRMFKVGDDYYETFEDALEAAEDGGTVQLAADIELEEPLSIEDMDITIDLAGHDITICAESEPAIGGSGEANITIIDSIGGGEVSNTDESEPVAVYTEGSLTIGAYEGDMGASFNAPVDADGDFLIIAGKFYDELTGMPGDDFGKIATGSTVSEDVDADGYWVVTAGEPPVVESYKVSWEPAANATTDATVDDVGIDNPSYVEIGKTVVFMVEPDDDYEFAEEEYVGWEITEEGNLTRSVTIVDHDVEITIPEPTEVEPEPETVQIQLPIGTAGVAGYIVSNLTEGVAIAADDVVVVGGATYTLPIGAKVEIWVVPADGYRVTGNPYVINEVTSGTTVAVENLPAVEAIVYVAQIGDDKYETLAEAVTAATSGQTVTVLADLAQTESIEVEGKDITFDLNGKTLTFNVSGDGFYFFNDADCSVKNGTIVMNVPATANWYSAIYFEDAGGLVKDVTINSGNCKYGVVTGVADYESLEGTADKTVVCENVDVTGSDLLFYAEAEKMTLDADCSATQVGAYTGDPAYSTALAAGWLGQLTVNGGAYTAAANVVGTMSSPATITLNAGTYSGNFNYVPVSEGYKEMGDHVITKAEEVELAAPAGYAWSVADADGMQQLVKTYAVTYSLAAGVRAVVSNETTAAVATYDGPATNSFTVSAGDTIYVEYSSLEAGYEPTVEGGSYMITDNKTLLPVELDPIVYDITYHDATVTNGVTEYTIETGTFALPTAENGVEAQDGANFIGWTNALGQTVTEVTPGTTTGDLDFYAVWEPVVGPSWDIPGAEGGINALVKEDGTKYVEFTSVTFTATGATVGLHAKEINANGQDFGLVCKTDITKGDTFVINATLNYEQGELGTPTEGLFTITADLSEYDQLFVVGVGPAADDE